MNPTAPARAQGWMCPCSVSSMVMMTVMTTCAV